MCFSAQIEADAKKLARRLGGAVDIEQFVMLFKQRQAGLKAAIPKAMAASFEDQPKIHALILEYETEQTAKLEQEIFAQKTRLADAERSLQSKVTKAASESKRIAADKISRAMTRLADIKRSELKDRDSRIFPGGYAPVLVVESGQKIIKPMRYQCRLEGRPANYDFKYPGTYNARRDNLEGFWKKQFGYTHGIMIVNAFYENVSRHAMEGRELAEGEKEENVVLEFRPEPRQDMLVACLWSRWEGQGDELLSFAAITDEPPAEVAAAGHDRCIIPIKPEHVDAWLNPDPGNLAAMYAILDDRARPYYEHRLAA
jgi:putative SOS response-associated peptidase YedK